MRGDWCRNRDQVSILWIYRMLVSNIAEKPLSARLPEEQGATNDSMSAKVLLTCASYKSSGTPISQQHPEPEAGGSPYCSDPNCVYFKNLKEARRRLGRRILNKDREFPGRKSVTQPHHRTKKTGHLPVSFVQRLGGHNSVPRLYIAQELVR
jgi:hypothetical protein